MASVLAVRPKKKSKIDPAVETELNDLGPPPSTSDLGELFETDAERPSPDRPESSVIAFTEDTTLDDSRANSQAKIKDGEDSRSSTPSSGGGFGKKIKRNVVTPIHEETSFGIDNKVFENDQDIPKSAWSDMESEAGSRPSTAPINDNPRNESSLRPSSAPQGSPRFFGRSGKVSPAPFEVSEDNNTTKTAVELFPIENETAVDESAEPSTSVQQHVSIPTSTKKDMWAIEEENNEKVDTPEKESIKEEDQISVMSTVAVLAPPQTSGEYQAYIPIDYAKEAIQKVIDDMKKMKANHYKVVEQIQEQYQLIEEESQAQFNTYVIKLRGEYNTKVATFKHVIESHQTEYTNKQKFYEQAIKSLRDKNRSLLLEKRQFLLKAKDTNAKNVEEKSELLSDLTGMLDQKQKEFVTVREMYTEEKSLREQAETENVQLKKELSDMKSCLDTNSGESQTLFQEFDDLKSEMAELKLKFNELEEEKQTLTQSKELVVEEKTKLEEQYNEKEKVIKETDETLEKKNNEIEEYNKLIEELKLKIEELVKRPVVAGVTTSTSLVRTDTIETRTTELQQSSQVEPDVVVPAPISGDLLVYEKKNKELEEVIKQLKQSLEDVESKNKEEQEKRIIFLVKNMKKEKNENAMLLINAEEKNRLLHHRLEGMLNQVMDSVDPGQTQSKLEELKGNKALLESEVDGMKEKIEDWKEEYRKEHDGEEPSEDAVPEDLLNELKVKTEQIVAIDKEILIINMLLDGTLPDDMKQGDNNDQPSATEELKRQFQEENNLLIEENNKLRDQSEELRKKAKELKEKIEELERKIEELEAREPEKIIQTVTATAEEGATTVEVTKDQDSSDTIKELTTLLTEAETRCQELETEHNTELESQKKHLHKIEKKLTKLQNEKEQLEADKRDLESQLKVLKESSEAELSLKQENLDDAKKEIERLNDAKLSKLPVKAKTEIKALQEKLKQTEEQQNALNQEILDLKSKNAELTEQSTNLNVTITGLQAKEAELQRLKEVDKKYKELKKKYKTLEAKKVVTKTIPQPAGATTGPATGDDTEKVTKLQKRISELEKQVENTETVRPTTAAAAKKDSKTDAKSVLKLEKANETLKDKVEGMKKTALADAEKIKELQEKVKEAKAKGDEKSAKKQEKAMKDMQKKLGTEQKKTAKLKEDLDKEKEELANLKTELESFQSESKRDKAEIAKLGVAAKEGLESAEKVIELSKSNKSLTEENKTLAENFNSERILRKKYYNMVEDMKGKIRVYARARPLSRSELERGNHNIITSPDEYSLIVQAPRGPKDFQYDAVFTAEHSQEKVFEDTNNLIQSAFDGYNVCIFAYGQTGSGKTFTMIGDKEQNFPGIAPRAFKAIYSLIEENKSKFSFTTSMYMMELYRDNLIDLFGNTKGPAKLDIKKDKKGMVVVSGAVIKEADSSEQLMEIFETGSANRHIASTKMNSESSRSHLVLSITIESTSLTSGAVVKGKLSLVDLAGSERAAKTGATPEQLKEAQSINKSLSALGDVISALSSEQSFIPYRNNKLTMLMQDSLGGNAKTLMFVNISPADYNCDETITSLTYASRVKLITNDASKNSDNKEIAKLKGIIAKLKKGENVDEEDV